MGKMKKLKDYVESLSYFIITCLFIFVVFMFLYLFDSINVSQILMDFFQTSLFVVFMYVMYFLPKSLMVKSSAFKWMCLKLYKNYFWLYVYKLKYDFKLYMYIKLSLIFGMSKEVWFSSSTYGHFNWSKKSNNVESVSLLMMILLFLENVIFFLCSEICASVVFVVIFFLDKMSLIVKFFETCSIMDFFLELKNVFIFMFLFALGLKFVMIYFVLLYVFFIFFSICEMMDVFFNGPFVYYNFGFMNFFETPIYKSFFWLEEQNVNFSGLEGYTYENNFLLLENMRLYYYDEHMFLECCSSVYLSSYEKNSFSFLLEFNLVMLNYSFYSILLKGMSGYVLLELSKKLSKQVQIENNNEFMFVKPMESMFNNGVLKRMYFMKKEKLSVFDMYMMVDKFKFSEKNFLEFKFDEFFSCVKYYVWQEEDKVQYLFLLSYNSLDFNLYCFNNFFSGLFSMLPFDCYKLYMFWTYDLKISIELMYSLKYQSSMKIKFSYMYKDNGFKVDDLLLRDMTLMEEFVFFLCWCYWYSNMQDYLKLKNSEEYLSFMKEFYNFVLNKDDEEMKEVWSKEDYYVAEMYNMKTFWKSNSMLKDYSKMATSFDVMMSEKLVKDKHMKKLLFACVSCNVEMKYFYELLDWLSEQGLGYDWKFPMVFPYLVVPDIEDFFVFDYKWVNMYNSMLDDKTKGIEDLEFLFDDKSSYFMKMKMFGTY